MINVAKRAVQYRYPQYENVNVINISIDIESAKIGFDMCYNVTFEYDFQGDKCIKTDPFDLKGNI